MLMALPLGWRMGPTVRLDEPSAVIDRAGTQQEGGRCTVADRPRAFVSLWVGMKAAALSTSKVTFA